MVNISVSSTSVTWTPRGAYYLWTVQPPDRQICGARHFEIYSERPTWIYGCPRVGLFFSLQFFRRLENWGAFVGGEELCWWLNKLAGAVANVMA